MKKDTSNTSSTQYGQGDATYRAVGGAEGLKKLVNDFYDKMETMPRAKNIRDMHAEDLTETRDKLYCFLSGWMGGPTLYKEKYGSINIPQAHKHLDIGEEERDAWMCCMRNALKNQPYPEELKNYLLQQLSIPAEACRTK